MARARQGHLETMEPETIPEIDAAAENYVRERNKRMKLTEKEKEAHEVLLAAMLKHELSSYEYDGQIVFVSEGKRKVKVNEKDEPKGEDDIEE